MPIGIVTKFGEDRVRIARVRVDKVNFDEFHQLRGQDSEVTWTNWLVIDLTWIMPICTGLFF